MALLTCNALALAFYKYHLSLLLSPIQVKYYIFSWLKNKYSNKIPITAVLIPSWSSNPIGFLRSISFDFVMYWKQRGYSNAHAQHHNRCESRPNNDNRLDLQFLRPRRVVIWCVSCVSALMFQCFLISFTLKLFERVIFFVCCEFVFRNS